MAFNVNENKIGGKFSFTFNMRCIAENMNKNPPFIYMWMLIYGKYNNKYTFMYDLIFCFYMTYIRNWCKMDIISIAKSRTIENLTEDQPFVKDFTR